MNTQTAGKLDREIDVLLSRGWNPHCTTLEDYVAYQWESCGDLLGQRHGERRNRIALDWLADAIRTSGPGAACLDVGCSYGNHLFMLNAILGKPSDVEFVGIDLFDGAVERATSFSKIIPGFSNCRFQRADLSSGLPFPDDSFTAINLCDVIEHMVTPVNSLRELYRIAKPGGTLVISTPLKDSLFKRLASVTNRLSGGKLYRAYYNGKSTNLDENGNPVMETTAGHDHVSEMSLSELKAACIEAGFTVREVELMSVMSGSRWFDRHPVLLAGLLLVETVHDRLRIPSWAHSVMLRLEKPAA